MNQKGFTLIEVMIAMVVLCVGLLTLAQMQVSALNGNVSSNNMTVANTLAQDKLEELKGLALDAGELADDNPDNNTALETLGADAAAPDHQDANNPIDSGGTTTGARRYTRVWNIADDTPVPGSKTVVVGVLWGANNSSTGYPRHRVFMSTIVSE